MKKYIVSILVTSVFLMGAPFITPKASAADLNIRDFINLLVAIGVIPADKLPTVNAYLATLDNPINNPVTPVICASDAKLCSDGSYVGRTGQNCQFVCPTSTIVTQQPITVLSPNGGENFNINSPITVTWNMNHVVTNNAISIIINSLTSQKGYSSPLMTGKVGTNQFIIPANSMSSNGQYKVQVCDHSTSTTNNPDATCDSSDSYFNIMPTTITPSPIPVTPPASSSSPITVLSPSSTATAGNVVFASVSSDNLVTRWNSSTQNQPVDISIIDAASLKTISTLVYNNIRPVCSSPTTCTQSYGMSITPGTISNGSYFVQICSAGTSNCGKSQTFQFSNAEASIKIISPNGGERLIKGQTYNIQWQASGLDKVNINLMTNYGDNTINPSAFPFFLSIASAVPASSGSYSWTVPSSIPNGSNYNIGIGKNQIGVLSENYFTITSAN